MVVPFLIGCLRRTPDTYHLAGIKRGTATSNFHAQRDNLNEPPSDPGRFSELLLLADYEPQSPEEWEQRLKVIRKAVRKQAIAAAQRPGMPDEPVVLQLVHAHCQRRSSTGIDSERGTAIARL
jgi:hypothetical protein